MNRPEVTTRINGRVGLREAFVYVDGTLAAIVREIDERVWCHTCADNCTTEVRETFNETLGELVALPFETEE